MVVSEMCMDPGIEIVENCRLRYIIGNPKVFIAREDKTDHVCLATSHIYLLVERTVENG